MEEFKNKYKQAKRNIIYNEIRKTKGHFFYVEFVKQDKTLRKLFGRIGVKNYPTKTGKKIKTSHPLEIGVFRVYDTGKKQYRSVNLDTVKKISINKKVLKWTK
tara:strand:- start:941 stop:1249 length:309 start_codon:yes stop_codon:yes gene_type:complete